MSDIQPTDPRRLTDHDVDYAPFDCCGDEDLVFLRCESCEHIWVECYECCTWYVSLDDLSRRQSSFFAEGVKPACPRCGEPFADCKYLDDSIVDRYLPTREQVVCAGYSRFLADTIIPADETAGGKNTADDFKPADRTGEPPCGSESTPAKQEPLDGHDKDGHADSEPPERTRP